MNSFITRIALINSIGFAGCVAIPTIVDPRLAKQVVWGARNYPLGMWVVLIALLVYAATRFFMQRARKLNVKYVSSCIPLFMAVILVLPNFFPEFPHAFVFFWGVLFCFNALLATWIEYMEEDLSYLEDAGISYPIRMERLKETINFWRSLTMGLLTGYLGILLTFCILVLGYVPPMVSSDPAEQFYIVGAEGVQMVIFSLGVIMGPILGCIMRTRKTADYMLRLRSF